MRPHPARPLNARRRSVFSALIRQGRGPGVRAPPRHLKAHAALARAPELAGFAAEPGSAARVHQASSRRQRTFSPARIGTTVSLPKG
jgi:hypothetical protein